MKYLLPLFLALFGCVASGQIDLPDKGSLADIKGKTKVYLAADAFNLKLMVKEFHKQTVLHEVGSAKDADFIIEYKTTFQSSQGLLGVETGEVDVYVLRDNKKIIVWSESAKNGLNLPSTTLTKKFLKAFQKV